VVPFTYGTVVHCFLFFSKAIIGVVAWGCTKAASLCVVAFVAYMPVLVAFETLCNNAVACKWFTVMQFVLPDQASVD
jgi:hypothetical protein